MKKALWMLSAMFFLSSMAWAGSPGVTFLLRSGQKVSFAFTQKPIIAVSNSELSVSVAGVQRVSYAYADVQRVFLSDDVASGIAPVQADPSQQSVTFTWQDGVLRALGLIPMSKCTSSVLMANWLCRIGRKLMEHCSFLSHPFPRAST